jgi:hypothetical protein
VPMLVGPESHFHTPAAVQRAGLRVLLKTRAGDSPALLFSARACTDAKDTNLGTERICTLYRESGHIACAAQSRTHPAIPAASNPPSLSGNNSFPVERSQRRSMS